MDKIRDTVLEYWPELSKSWASAVKAIQHYKRNPGDLDIEVKAADKVRRIEEVKQGGAVISSATGSNEQVERIGEAMGEIRQFGRAGHSLDEIKRRTLGSANAISGDDSPWADLTIWNHLDKADRERLFDSTPP